MITRDDETRAARIIVLLNSLPVRQEQESKKPESAKGFAIRKSDSEHLHRFSSDVDQPALPSPLF